MLKIRYLILFIVLLQSRIFLAQNPHKRVSQFSIKDGLSQSSVICIKQDSRGFMWFGTQDGLNKFDGYKFTKFKNNPTDANSISNNWIYGIDEDKAGNLWIASKLGLNKYDPKTKQFTRFFHQQENSTSINGNEVYGVLVDKKGYVWAKTKNALCKLDTKTGQFINYEHFTEFSQPSESDRGLPIVETAEGNLWVASTSGLSFFNPKTELFEKYYSDVDNNKTLTSNKITALFIDKKQQLWIGTKNGLSLFDKAKKSFRRFLYTPDYQPSKNIFHITSIHEDYEGKIRIGTQNKGIFRLKQNCLNPSFISKTEIEKLSDKRILSICEDHSQNIWIGTENRGVIKVDLKEKKFSLYKNSNDGLPPAFSSNIILSVLEDESERLWIGTKSGGLNVFDRETGKINYFSPNASGRQQILGENVHAIFKDSDGNIWIGTENGINIYNPKKRKMSSLHDYFNYIYYSDFNNTKIYHINEDSQKNIWVASSNGLHMFNLQTMEVRSFHHNEGDKNSLSNNLVYCTIEDQYKQIWVGTFDGLNLLNADNETFRQITISSGEHVSHNPIYAIKESSTGEIWLGTANGMKKIKPQTFQIDDLIPNAFSSDRINSILEDKNHDIWYSTSSEINKLDIKSKQVQHFNEDDGLQELEFSQGAAYSSPLGELFFGGSGGLNVFFPDSMKTNKFVPPIEITSFSVTNEEKEREIIANESTEIIISANDYLFTIEFAALDFTMSQHNKYRYRMEGLSEKWIHIGTQHAVSFSNLAPGRYTFTVTGSNNDAIWNPSGKKLIIKVLPPFWRTQWAYQAYLFSILLSIYLFVIWRERRLKSDKRTLEKNVKDRTQEIELQKEEIKTQRDIAVAQRDEISRQRKQVSKTLETLKNTQRQLVETKKMASLGNLVAGVAHEINTPVGVSITASSTLMKKTEQFATLYKENKLTPNDLENYLQTIYQTNKLILSNLNRTAELIISFKRVSVDQSSEKKRKFKLNAYLHDVARSLAPKLKHQHLEIKINCDENLEIDSYPGTYAQIITNLVINSSVHAFEGSKKGEISIDIEKINYKKFKMIYRDNGKGIEPEVAARIFEPFFTTNMQSGTGLGMHIVYNLVNQRLKGQINLKSKARQGVEFTFVLPISNTGKPA